MDVKSFQAIIKKKMDCLEIAVGKLTVSEYEARGKPNTKSGEEKKKTSVSSSKSSKDDSSSDESKAEEASKKSEEVDDATGKTTVASK